MCDAPGHSHDASHAPLPAPPEASPRLRGELTRRGLLGAAGAGLLIATGGSPALGTAAAAAPVNAASSQTVTGASRRSRLTRGTRLLHADLHNHTIMSDGDGDPALAYESMRSAGLDVAALTDHSTLSANGIADAIASGLPPEVSKIGGITPTNWRRTKELADAADTPGAFTALRGFEWSHPLLGHVNVWFTEDYTDLIEAGFMFSLYCWLRRAPNNFWGGGADGIAGFNHPGREFLRFADFRFEPGMRDQMVSLEMFNRRDDYLFEGWKNGASSPLNQCLNVGWRTGLTGVTDEHGTDWGYPEGKGRAGLWVREHSRAGVKEAMRARRFFATRTSGLRLDATASSGWRRARMGQVLGINSGDVTFNLDVDRDVEWRDKTLHAQVLRPGQRAPEVVEVVPFSPGRPVRFTVPLDRADGDWVVLRISDPTQANATPGPEGHPCNDLGVAYTSPWWLEARP